MPRSLKRPTTSTERDRKRNRENRHTCDSRVAGWNNAAILIAHLRGLRLVIQKPAKRETKHIMARVPCVRVEDEKGVLYDAEAARRKLCAESPGEPHDSKRINTILRDILFGRLFEALEARGVDVRYASASNGAKRTSAGKPRPRIAQVRFRDIVLDNNNIIAVGQQVLNRAKEVFKDDKKGNDFPMETLGQNAFTIDLLRPPVAQTAPATLPATPPDTSFASVISRTDDEDVPPTPGYVFSFGPLVENDSVITGWGDI